MKRKIDHIKRVFTPSRLARRILLNGLVFPFAYYSTFSYTVAAALPQWVLAAWRTSVVLLAICDYTILFFNYRRMMTEASRRSIKSRRPNRNLLD